MTERITPFAGHSETVRAEWIDWNGHMNLAYYMLVFDHATDALLEHTGLGEDYVNESGNSVFVAEAHITYEREVMQGDLLRTTTQVLDLDAKRLHILHRMYASGGDDLAATNELMILHMDMSERRSAPFPETQMQALKQVFEAHRALERPAQAGRVIGIRRNPTQ